jgi:photosystem II stability/assembly factor-like uncharacterized protein
MKSRTLPILFLLVIISTALMAQVPKQLEKQMPYEYGLLHSQMPPEMQQKMERINQRREALQQQNKTKTTTASARVNASAKVSSAGQWAEIKISGINTGFSNVHGPMGILGHSSGLFVYSTIHHGIGSYLFFSPDQGQTWQQRNSPFSEIRQIIFADERMIAIGLVGTANKLYYSDDYGITWVPSSFPYNVGAGPHFAPGTLHFHKGNIFVRYNYQIWASSDFGANWVNKRAGSLVFGFASKGDTLVLNHDEDGISYTTDLGNTWKKALNIINPGYMDFSSWGVRASENWLYLLLDYGGIMVSSDFGDHWNYQEVMTPQQFSPFMDLILPNQNALIGFSDLGTIHVSNNNGKTWEEKNEGIDEDKIHSYTNGIGRMVVFGEKAFLAYGG